MTASLRNMNPVELVRWLEGEGVKLWSRGEVLVIDGPDNILSLQTIEVLEEKKPELLGVVKLLEKGGTLFTPIRTDSRRQTIADL